MTTYKLSENEMFLHANHLCGKCKSFNPNDKDDCRISKAIKKFQIEHTILLISRECGEFIEQ